jgi:GNAT superfamily N-acetyltransferase
MLTITQAESVDQLTIVAELLREYAEWVTSLFADGEHAPTFRALHQDLSTLPGIYAPPAGRLLFATLDGRPAGCVCLKPRGEDVCEMKRLYVRPAFRGHDIGRKLVLRLLDEARRTGYRRMVLDSHLAMKTAHALYESAGFRYTSAPAGFPDWLRPVVIFMAKDLTVSD